MLGVVVLVLDIDVAIIFLVVVVFVLEIIPVSSISSELPLSRIAATYCSASESCMKSSSSDMVAE